MPLTVGHMMGVMPPGQSNVARAAGQPATKPAAIRAQRAAVNQRAQGEARRSNVPGRGASQGSIPRGRAG